MREFRDRVAVVTGAASGIGRALAERLAAEGMKIVLADVEEARLREADEALRAAGARTLAVPVDVSRAEQVEDLAERAFSEFGGVHVLCNNAGVIAAGLSWEAPLSDYEWMLGVNLWGVVHGVRSFVPRMLASGEEGHVVNTASMAGVTTMPFASIYHMTKHAVVAYSECLYHELAIAGGRLSVSVLCPEVIDTRIAEAGRNRPAALQEQEPLTPQAEVVMKTLVERTHTGLPPERMAERVLQAIRDERFYILSEDAWRRACNLRLDDVREGRNPTFAPPE
jgi:NAD(P)-dependent dehydrogenase (short-subunit alcohol dehydrogenase family)